MISHVILLALAHASDGSGVGVQSGLPQADQPIRKERMTTTQTLVYPNELAHSIQPYTACLVDQMNMQYRELDGASEEEMPAVRAKSLAACASARDAAMGSGVKALQQTRVPNAQRANYVEKFITDLGAALLYPKPPTRPVPPKAK